MFISRKATIKDLKVHIAEILYENKKDISLKDLFNMSRLWRLDTGESISEIEKEFEYESYGLTNLPMQIRGKVLELNEVVSNINVADTDILLYEVKYNDFLKENNSYAFTAK